MTSGRVGGKGWGTEKGNGPWSDRSIIKKMEKIFKKMKFRFDYKPSDSCQVFSRLFRDLFESELWLLTDRLITMCPFESPTAPIWTCNGPGATAVKISPLFTVKVVVDARERQSLRLLPNCRSFKELTSGRSLMVLTSGRSFKELTSCRSFMVLIEWRSAPPLVEKRSVKVLTERRSLNVLTLPE